MDIRWEVILKHFTSEVLNCGFFACMNSSETAQQHQPEQQIDQIDTNSIQDRRASRADGQAFAANQRGCHYNHLRDSKATNRKPISRFTHTSYNSRQAGRWTVTRAVPKPDAP